MHGRQARGRDAGEGNSGTTGWIAVSRSGAYVPNGSCTHGIGANCDTSGTVIYRTDDAGVQWRRLLAVTMAPGPLVWIRLFTASDGLVAADVGPRGRGMLFRTSDGGRSWTGAVCICIDPRMAARAGMSTGALE